MITALKTTALVAVTAFTFATGDGCDDSHKSAPDPTPGSFTDVQNVRGFKMPSGFRNIIVFCDGPNMVYETSRGADESATPGSNSTLYVVPNDARCAK